MAHVTGVVDGGAAVVPRDAVPLLRHEGLLAPREAVVQLEPRPGMRVRGEVGPRGRRPRRLGALHGRAAAGHGLEAAAKRQL